jgi:hypothetical protein
MNEDGLWQSISLLSDVMEGLSDDVLGQDWTWRDHQEGVRFALIGTFHELKELAVDLRRSRQAAGNPVSSAQHVLGQYHSAYRDLQAVLLGVRDTELDIPPSPEDWSLRRVLGHIIGADLTFFVLVHFAVNWQRDGLTPRKVMPDEADSLVGTSDEFEQTMDNQGLTGIFAYYDRFHHQILDDLAPWNEEDLQAPSLFWEKEPLPVQYRLHRFDAHLRQHTVQVEKTMEGIGKRTNEARRLLRLVYAALAEVESLLIGAQELGLARRQEVASTIRLRAEEIQQLVAT